jgi:hypothetical protein
MCSREKRSGAREQRIAETMNMADMIPCKKCGHYDIVCDDEKNSYLDTIGMQDEVNRALQSSLTDLESKAVAQALRIRELEGALREISAGVDSEGCLIGSAEMQQIADRTLMDTSSHE